jgi:hypothetical protein
METSRAAHALCCQLDNRALYPYNDEVMTVRPPACQSGR